MAIRGNEDSQPGKIYSSPMRFTRKTSAKHHNDSSLEGRVVGKQAAARHGHKKSYGSNRGVDRKKNGASRKDKSVFPGSQKRQGKSHEFSIQTKGRNRGKGKKGRR